MSSRLGCTPPSFRGCARRSCVSKPTSPSPPPPPPPTAAPSACMPPLPALLAAHPLAPRCPASSRPRSSQTSASASSPPISTHKPSTSSPTLGRRRRRRRRRASLLPTPCVMTTATAGGWAARPRPRRHGTAGRPRRGVATAASRRLRMGPLARSPATARSRLAPLPRTLSASRRGVYGRPTAGCVGPRRSSLICSSRGVASTLTSCATSCALRPPPASPASRHARGPPTAAAPSRIERAWRARR